MITRQQLDTDLDKVAGLPFPKAAKKLYKLGYRMPDCSDRWQVDRLSGALVGAAMSSGHDSVADVLIRVVGLTQITSHKKED